MNTTIMYETIEHKGPWESKKFCPVLLEVKDRPYGCGKPIEHVDSVLCEFCPKFLDIRGLTFRGFKYARSHIGTKEPSVESHDTFRDNRFSSNVVSTSNHVSNDIFRDNRFSASHHS